MSSKTRTVGDCSARRSKRMRQAEKRFSWSPGAAPLEREQVRQARLDPLPLLEIGEVLVESRPQLLARRLRLLLLGDPAAHPDHLGECPVGDPLAVCETSPAVPPDVLDETVDVLLELPGEA
jgi:hypothetical protein